MLVDRPRPLQPFTLLRPALRQARRTKDPVRQEREASRPSRGSNRGRVRAGAWHGWPAKRWGPSAVTCVEPREVDGGETKCCRLLQQRLLARCGSPEGAPRVPARADACGEQRHRPNAKSCCAALLSLASTPGRSGGLLPSSLPV